MISLTETVISSVALDGVSEERRIKAFNQIPERQTFIEFICFVISSRGN